jgi:hypothetical protein
LITISHNHEDGTLVYGTSKGDGVYEILKDHGFRWFPSIAMIGIRGSRDRMAKTWIINGAAEALRNAGHEVTVEIDNTHRDHAQVLADKAERLEDRKEALEAKAAKQFTEAQRLWDHSDRLVEHIPPGQPILIGHHSERGHRRTLERSRNAMIKGCETHRAAKQTAQRAAVAGLAHKLSERPDVTARRIEKLEADLRDIDRKLNGYERRSLNGRGEVLYVDTHAPATGEWREGLEARRAQIQGQLDYDRQALADAVASGGHTVYSRENVKVGDIVRRSSGTWYRVTKVNKVSVSVATGYSWDDKIRFTDIREARPAKTKEAADA